MCSVTENAERRTQNTEHEDQNTEHRQLSFSNRWNSTLLDFEIQNKFEMRFELSWYRSRTAGMQIFQKWSVPARHLLAACKHLHAVTFFTKTSHNFLNIDQKKQILVPLSRSRFYLFYDTSKFFYRSIFKKFWCKAARLRSYLQGTEVYGTWFSAVLSNRFYNVDIAFQLVLILFLFSFSSSVCFFSFHSRFFKMWKNRHYTLYY